MARVKLHARAIREVERSAGVRKMLHDKMEPALDKAQADAPVLSGAYRDSLHLEDVEEDGVPRTRLVAGVRYAVFVEAEDGVLARSLDAVE